MKQYYNGNPISGSFDKASQITCNDGQTVEDKIGGLTESLTNLIKEKYVTFTYVDYEMWSTSLDTNERILSFCDANYLICGINGHVRILYCNSNYDFSHLPDHSTITLKCLVATIQA